VRVKCAQFKAVTSNQKDKAMTKKHFISLADAIIHHNKVADRVFRFDTPYQLQTLADWCAQQNPQFNRDRWLAYIAGECGPNGGAVKK